MDIKFTNKNNAIILTVIIFIFFLFTIVLPLVSLYLIPQSKIGSWLFSNIYLLYCMFPFLVYFIYTGVYFYYIKIDSYIISITSFRTLSSFFTSKSYVDISHLMLEDYRFIPNRFSLNTILILKIKTEQKIIAKRFNLSLLRDRDQDLISRYLDKVLKEKKC